MPFRSSATLLSIICFVMIYGDQVGDGVQTDMRRVKQTKVQKALFPVIHVWAGNGVTVVFVTPCSLLSDKSGSFDNSWVIHVHWCSNIKYLNPCLCPINLSNLQNHNCQTSVATFKERKRIVRQKRSGLPCISMSLSLS